MVLMGFTGWIGIILHLHRHPARPPAPRRDHRVTKKVVSEYPKRLFVLDKKRTCLLSFFSSFFRTLSGRSFFVGLFLSCHRYKVLFLYVIPYTLRESQLQ